jgi:hypothetical protein
MTLVGLDTLSDIHQRGVIRDSDVARLASLVDGDPHGGTELVEGLLRIDAACRLQDPAWAPFMVATITRHIVLESEPRGYVNATKCDWLLGRATRNGVIERSAILDLLIAVIAAARWSPATLSAIILRSIAAAVRTGRGACRAGLAFEPGHLTIAEIALVRRTLLAFASHSGQAVTGPEAHALLDIEIALGDGLRHSSWSDLLAKALLSHAMDVSGYALGGREAALAVVPAREIAAQYGPREEAQQGLSKLEQQRIEIITGETVPDGETDRLAARIAGLASGTLDGLIELLARHCQTLHPAFASLAGRGRVAA